MQRKWRAALARQAFPFILLPYGKHGKMGKVAMAGNKKRAAALWTAARIDLVSAERELQLPAAALVVCLQRSHLLCNRQRRLHHVPLSPFDLAFADGTGSAFGASAGRTPTTCYCSCGFAIDR